MSDEHKGRLFTATNASVIAIHQQLNHLAMIRLGAPSFDGLGALPTPDQLASFLETAFWASLRTEEARVTSFSATLAARQDVPGATVLKNTVSYDENQVAKIAPAMPLGGCLGVSLSVEGFAIWGLARGCPGALVNSITVRVSEPGVLRVSVGPFDPFAMLDGRSDLILDGENVSLADALQRALRKPLPVDDVVETQAVWREAIAVTELARIILREGHGGTLLFVTEENEEWDRSLEFAYRFATPDTTIPDAIRQELNDSHAFGEQLAKWSQMDLPVDVKNAGLALSASTPQRDIGNLIRPIASLARVDGAVVMTKGMRIVGCGAKIYVGHDAISTVCLLKALSGEQRVIQAPLETIGGTRHQSAARFVGAHRDAVAVVVSQDRRLSLIHWQESINSVEVIHNAEWWA
jgi:sensor domain DACNV-containing protein